MVISNKRNITILLSHEMILKSSSRSFHFKSLPLMTSFTSKEMTVSLVRLNRLIESRRKLRSFDLLNTNAVGV